MSLRVTASTPAKPCSRPIQAWSSSSVTVLTSSSIAAFAFGSVRRRRAASARRTISARGHRTGQQQAEMLDLRDRREIASDLAPILRTVLAVIDLTVGGAGEELEAIAGIVEAHRLQ